MLDDIMARQLHDQATRGGSLTAEEQVSLEKWYAQQDAAEAAQITASDTTSPAVESLRTEVSAAVRRLNEVTQKIQIQSEANEALRREIAVLVEELSPAQASQAA